MMKFTDCLTPSCIQMVFTSSGPWILHCFQLMTSGVLRASTMGRLGRDMTGIVLKAPLNLYQPTNQQWGKELRWCRRMLTGLRRVTFCQNFGDVINGWPLTLFRWLFASIICCETNAVVCNWQIIAILFDRLTKCQKMTVKDFWPSSKTNLIS